MPAPAAPAPAPAAGELQVWALPLAGIDSAAAARWLDPTECDGARRFTAAGPRHEFIATRSALRLLLGTALGCAPAAVPLARGERGKPQLAGGATAAGALHFNVSHSGGLALLAFAIGHPVGIDVEALRPLPEVDDLAARIFDADDLARWRALPAARRLPAFYGAWTRKEACAKARGDGLWADLPAIRVGFDALPPSVAHGPQRGDRWPLCELPLAAHAATHTACVTWLAAATPAVALHWLDASAWARLEQAARAQP